MKLADMIKREKIHMNRIRFIVNYVVVPIYAILILLCLMAAAVLLTIDEIKYTPAAIVIFCFTGLLSILLLASVPFVRKMEIRTELSRYNFDDSEITDKDVYTYSIGDTSATFDKNGMYLDGNFYWYNHLLIIFATSKELMRIWISIQFMTNDGTGVNIVITNELIHMLKQFGITTVNQEALAYTIRHKQAAFTQIYKTGTVNPKKQI